LHRRVTSAAQRAHRRGYSPSLSVAQVDIDLISRTVRCRGEVVTLSPKAYELLVVLMRRPDVVVPRAELLKQVWGYVEDTETRTLDAHIGELRRRLEVKPSRPRLIRTAWRVGYSIVSDGAADA
jgi:DNA-binding response OmpR family regulator